MSNVSSMSITRALATIKALNTEIEAYWRVPRQMLGIQVGIAGKDTNNPGMDASQCSKVFQSTYDTIVGMMDKVEKLRNAINTSNYTTTVEVNGKSMTISEALVLKNNLPLKEKLLEQLRNSHNTAVKEVARLTEQFEKRVDTVANATMPADATVEERNAHITMVRKTQTELVGPMLLDPLKIGEKIAALEKEISFVKLELDYTLSTSNTVTTVEVAL